jgi:hypothetical protein
MRPGLRTQQQHSYVRQWLRGVAVFAEPCSGDTDLALGTFWGERQSSGICPRDHRKRLAFTVCEGGQEQWEDVWDSGLISTRTVMKWAGEVWTKSKEEEDSD